MPQFFKILAELENVINDASSGSPTQPSQGYRRVPHTAPVRQSVLPGLAQASAEGFSAQPDDGFQTSPEVTDDPKSDTPKPDPVSTPGTNVHPAAQLLRSPGGLRNAMLMNEILGAPVSRRQGRRF